MEKFHVAMTVTYINVIHPYIVTLLQWFGGFPLEIILIQWKPLIMITLASTLFDNNYWLITLSGGYKNLHYLTQFIVTTSYMYKKQVEFSLSSLL